VVDFHLLLFAGFDRRTENQEKRTTKIHRNYLQKFIDANQYLNLYEMADDNRNKIVLTGARLKTELGNYVPVADVRDPVA
jgi:hypothetical protein